MNYDPPLEEGRLLRRYKRFLADIETGSGEALTIHCPNTGSMFNCMAEGARVWFQRNADPKRKLPATWEWVETPQGRLACINTQRANQLVAEALAADMLPELPAFSRWRREVRYGRENSRVDFLLEGGDAEARTFVEVKSVTLGFDDSPIAAFPDAVTQRGARHLRELAEMVRQGERAVLLYCVALSGIEGVRVAREIDPAYARALDEARGAGVEIRARGVVFSSNSLVLGAALPFLD